MLIQSLLIVALGLSYFFLPDFTGFFYISIGLVTVFLVYDFIVSIVFNAKTYSAKGKTELTSAEVMGNEINEAYNFGEIGIAITNRDNDILWVNEFLSSRCPDIVDRKILDVFPSLSSLETSESSLKVKVTYESHTYLVEKIKDVRLYFFKDITEFENVDNYNSKVTPAIGYFTIDNYFDVQMNVSDEAKFADMVSALNVLFHNFSEKYSAMVRRVKEDRYFFITTKENYDKLYLDKFAIVDDVRNAFPNGFTISIGVSYGFDNFAKLSDLASSALDVALSRGGDQTVISPFGSSLIYIGGKTELKPARNRVKMRTISHSLLTILESYKKILIMGHDNADFDAIGSSLGAYLLCRHVNVNAKICWEDQLVEDKCRVAIQSQYTESEMDHIFIGYKDAMDWIDNDTLLLMVDHNNPRISMFPEIVKKMSNIAIVDHHRPGSVVINNPVFTGVDTSASSASELFTSYIIYSPDDIDIDQRTATFLLSGIALDTHSFRERTTMLTFEAGSELKNFNADSGKVDDFMKENLEEYRQKISILNSAETPYYGAMITSSPDTDIVNQIILATVATESVNIRGISVAFCIGRVGEHEVKVSARSDGTVNCQFIMEKMGGGGHFTMAACAYQDLKVDEVKEKLKHILNDYLDDATVKK